MKKIIQYMCAVAGLLLMLLSCQDDAMIINPDVPHGSFRGQNGDKRLQNRVL